MPSFKLGIKCEVRESVATVLVIGSVRSIAIRIARDLTRD